MDYGYKAYLKALEDRHGKLVHCSSSYTSSGMMMNSNSLISYELKIEENDKSVLTVRNKQPFKKCVITTYSIMDKDLKDICDFVEENRFWAFSELEYYQDPNYIVFDYSSSSSISLGFDDRSVGGSPYSYLSINDQAMSQHGFGELSTKFTAQLSSLMEKGRILSFSEEGEDSNFFNNMSVFTDKEKPEQKIEPDEGNNVCPSCGYHPVEGKFCPECGYRVKE